MIRLSAHFGKAIPIIFLYLAPIACAAIRTQLKMDKRYGIWLDLGCSDETMRRVTILPDRITEESKTILKMLYENEMDELDSKAANEILVRSSPKESVHHQVNQQRQDLLLGRSGPASTSSSSSSASSSLSALTAKLCQYPPGTGNSIIVTLEDYSCLADENFLNDQIIEFYFRWLQFELMSESDRARTHFFTTFFYNKLTKRPPRPRNRLHQVEDNQNLTPAEKRYERVKRWTKKVNLFEKDFIVVPINEQ